MGKIITRAEAQVELDDIYGKGVYRVNKMLPDKATRTLRVEVECCRCATEKNYIYSYLKRNDIKCMCSNPEGLRKLAKNYATVELYIEPDEGLIVGKDLEEYIIASLGHDKPNLKHNQEFIELVEEYLLETYEKKKATRCNRCKSYHPKRKLHRGLCTCCRMGVK